MHTASAIFNPDETDQLIQLTAEVMQRRLGQISIQHTYRPSEGIMAKRKLPPDGQ